MPTLLDDHLVVDALNGLTGWSGDAKRITRTVRLEDPEPALEAIAAAADTLNHHPVVDRTGDEVTFTLWTHSKGGVTELDIALASRIDDLLKQHGGDEPVGEHKPSAPAS
jgi:4a-hydroxytetrahydrobiopterin dehydratase